jgi:hypothetical protein
MFRFLFISQTYGVNVFDTHDIDDEIRSLFKDGYDISTICGEIAIVKQAKDIFDEGPFIVVGINRNSFVPITDSMIVDYLEYARSSYHWKLSLNPEEPYNDFLRRYI